MAIKLKPLKQSLRPSCDSIYDSYFFDYSVPVLNDLVFFMFNSIKKYGESKRNTQIMSKAIKEIMGIKDNEKNN